MQNVVKEPVKSVVPNWMFKNKNVN